MPAANAASPLSEGLSSEVAALAQGAGLTFTMAGWLVRRGLTDPSEVERFLEPKLQHLTAPEAMVDRDAAAERLAAAVRGGERIAVFGDYDCDGITSCAIMTDALRQLGAEVTPLLASRFSGGYGVTAEAAERVRSTGATLLVTCDCGSSDHAVLAGLRQAGVDAVVIDHHLVPAEPLPVVAFLNPNRPECGFPFKGLASCGLALSVVAAVRTKLQRALDVRQWLDLVAIGTIADVVSLTGDNRPLVRAGLTRLQQGGRPGVVALLELARMEATRALTAEDVAFRLAPRLNAPGRMGPPDLALELLLARSHAEARGLAARVEQLQLERRALQDKMIAEAVDEIERDQLATRGAIVIGREGWNHGIVGIVAGRLASRYGLPAVVVGFDAGTGVGSARGPAGSRLYDALAHAKDTVLRFGGHQAAAGVTVERERFAQFREAFEHACGALAGEAAASASDPVVELHPGDELSRVLADFTRLEPCGQDNPAPLLAVQAQLLVARAVRGGHLKLELELERGRRISGFGPNLGEHAATLEGHVRVVGRLRPDDYRGAGAVELKLSDAPTRLGDTARV